MTDQIEQRLQEIEERNHYAFDKEHDSVWKFRNAVSRSAEDVPALCKALRRAVKTLESNAVPRLGGKQQQYEAQAALTDIAAILSGEEGQ